MFTNYKFLITILFVCCCTYLHAQPPSWTFDLLNKEKKPEKFENKKLGSEKTADKKFTLPRRFLQNTVTHYNFVFNANNKLNAVLERAKIAQKDDYTKMLSFYPYSLENTAMQAQDLDSVILKSTAGILLHDLRNDWVDNLYLLIGKAYLLRRDFDSAGMTFQFINYNLFPRKKGEDDNRVVGTNSAASGNVISIANPEKRNIVQKMFSRPHSRNESLIWLVRNFIEQKDYAEAAGLINTLQNDPNFPRRLSPDLEEVTAYWFYNQGLYDSAAVHLEKGLSNAENKTDKARSEFLLAQLYELSGKFDKASEFYDKAAKHTSDPLMDIYAKLNDAKMLRTSGNLDKSIDNLLKMARRDRFESFRDIIYFSAGQIALQKPDTAEATGYLMKSMKYSQGNISLKNNTFLALGDMAYVRKAYREAHSWYDSLQLSDTALQSRLEELRTRREALGKIVAQLDIINREDSLQTLAALPPVEREIILKKIVRQLRKEKGLKEEESNSSGGGNAPIAFDNEKSKPIDLFDANSSRSGSWYFYNNAAKSKGFNDFRSKWGDRSNADNWRRRAAAQVNVVAVNPLETNKENTGTGDSKGKIDALGEISVRSLLSTLPIDPEKLAESNALLSGSLYKLARLYQEDLEDYESAIATYERSLERYPDSLYDGQLYLGLYFCWNKLGNTEKANYYKRLLTQGKFAGSYAAKIINDPGSADPNRKTPEATKRYDNIYNLFIEGRFEEALKEKKRADSVYGSNYWSPQLLYIEAVYHVRQREDSVAILLLQTIGSLYPKSPLKAKAENMIEVLGRRKEIEDYLSKLDVTRAAEEPPVKVPDDPAPVQPKTEPDPVPEPPTIAAPKNDPAAVATLPGKPKDKTAPSIAPKLLKEPLKNAPIVLSNGPFSLVTDSPHVVVMLLEKVDVVYVNEARNAFLRFAREASVTTPIEIIKDTLDGNRTMLLFSTFENAALALDYYEKVKRVAPNEVSWLPANKYSFFIINAENLDLLKTNKNLEAYRKLLNMQYPGKF